MFVPLRKAVELTGLHPHTLRKYADNGKINHYKNAAGQRLFDIQSLPGQQRVISSIICYCRVSSTKQKDDLARQVAFMRHNFPEAEIIQDIGSGLNYKRKGFKAILERLMQKHKLTLIVAHRDRLCRFGFEIIDHLVKQNGGEIMVLDQSTASPDAELVQDILSIIHVFSCRIHGLKQYGDSIKKDKDITNISTEEII
jgi:predicted site-specific integrase-resolvase